MRQRIPVYKLKLVQDRSVTIPSVNADDPRQVLALFFHKLIGQAEREHLAALLYNRHGEPLGASIIGIGAQNHLSIPAEEVLKCALVANASKVVLAHNHPCGAPDPSPQDILTTRHLVKVGGYLGVNVLDHLIVTPAGGFCSFVELGLMSRLRAREGEGANDSQFPAP